MKEVIVLCIIVGLVAATFAYFDFKDTPEEAAAKEERRELLVLMEQKEVEIPHGVSTTELMLALDEIEHITFFERIERCQDDFPNAG